MAIELVLCSSQLDWQTRNITAAVWARHTESQNPAGKCKPCVSSTRPTSCRIRLSHHCSSHMGRPWQA